MSEPLHQAFARHRIVVMCAPSGARRGKADHAAIPLTPPELAADAAALLEAGVSILHLHVRDRDGAHTLDVKAYREALAAIAARIGDRLIVQVTTESVGHYTREQQMRTVRSLKPEAVSLALNELCPDDAVELEAAGFYAWLKKERIWPQHILYSPDEVHRFDRLRRRGVFAEEHPFCLFVLGNYGSGVEGTTAMLDEFLAAADCSRFPWAACCFGGREHQVMRAAGDLGGHVRIGFENNLWLPDGSPAHDNAHLVRRFVRHYTSGGRRPASADEIRNRLF